MALNATLNLKKKMQSISDLEVDTKYLTPALIRASLLFGKGRLVTDQTDINTIMTNRAYDYYVKGWQRTF